MIQGYVESSDDLQSQYDFLAALIHQVHRHATEAKAGLITQDEALDLIISDTVIPCPNKVNVLRSKDVLLARIKELEG